MALKPAIVWGLAATSSLGVHAALVAGSFFVGASSRGRAYDLVQLELAPAKAASGPRPRHARAPAGAAMQQEAQKSATTAAMTEGPPASVSAAAASDVGPDAPQVAMAGVVLGAPARGLATGEGDEAGGGERAGGEAEGGGLSGGTGDGGDVTPDCWRAIGAELSLRSRTKVPRSIRQRGLTGEVVLRLRFFGGGAPARVEVEQSSGSPLLDEAVRLLATEPFSAECHGEGRWRVRFLAARG
jgi:outer membrane biosynthesis protein TonB